MLQATIINPFTIRIRERNSHGFLDLSNLPSGDDFFDVFQDYLSSLESHSHIDETTERGLKVVSRHTSGRTIDGQLKAGRFGYSAELENVQTGEKTDRTTDDCEYLPLYYRADIRRGTNEAILLLQRFGVHGAKSDVLLTLQSFLNDRYSDQRLTVLINPLITDAAIKEALGGNIQKIRYLKATIPSDVADSLHLDDNAEIDGEIELVVKTKKGSRWNLPRWMLNMASGRIDASEYLEINDIVYDNIKLTVDVNGKTKTVPIEDIQEKLRMNIDITSDVTYAKDGHPTLASIRREVKARMPDFYFALGWPWPAPIFLIQML